MENTQFSSVEEASKRWIEEGKKYKNGVNDWLDIIYMDKQQPTEACPEETRKDMSSYIFDKIQEYNNTKKIDELRVLFPPDTDPLDLNQKAACVSKVLLLDDDRIVTTINDWYQERLVYMLDGNNINLLEDGIFMTGKSHDKKYIAKVYPEKIDIHEGWDGKIVTTVTPPKSYGEIFIKENPAYVDDLSEKDFSSMLIHQVVVFPKGDKVAIASSAGIFVLDQKNSQVITTEYFECEEDEHGEYEMNLEYPHVDISPDEQYLVAGSKDSDHSIFENKDSVWVVSTKIEPFSSYPNFAKFNYNIEKNEKDEKSGPQLLLSACHFSRSASVSIPIDQISSGTEIYTNDENSILNYVDNQKWVFAVGAPYSWGWALGSNDGYIWFKYYNGIQLGYLHVGLSVMDIDFSQDRKKMIVASYGQVTVYNISEVFSQGGIFRLADSRDEKRKDLYAISNTAYVDEKRYLFLNVFDGPVIW